MSDNNPSFEDNLFALKTDLSKRKVRQTNLAGALSLSQSRLSRLLNGKDPFDFTTLLKLVAHADSDVSLVLPELKEQLQQINEWLQRGDQKNALLTLANLMELRDKYDDLKKAG